MHLGFKPLSPRGLLLYHPTPPGAEGSWSEGTTTKRASYSIEYSLMLDRMREMSDVHSQGGVDLVRGSMCAMSAPCSSQPSSAVWEGVPSVLGAPVVTCTVARRSQCIPWPSVGQQPRRRVHPRSAVCLGPPDRDVSLTLHPRQTLCVCGE